MNILFVVSHPRDWPIQVPGVRIVPARSYLMDAAYGGSKDTKLFNLCNSYRYQKRGYYVSLLAEARGHQPLPDIKAIEDLHSGNLIHLLTESLDDLIQSSLAHVDTDAFTLDVYFGRTPDRRYEQLSEQLFNLLHIPLLRAGFTHLGGQWQLRSVRAIHIADIAPHDRAALEQAAADCLKGHKLRIREPAAQKPALAILHSPDCLEEPSNPRALQKFREAAEALGMRTGIITRDDGERLTQFDALFIRDNTNANHYTYQLSRQAAVAGLVVIDDPDSIVKCNNKIYVAELLHRHHIPAPKAMTVTYDNLNRIVPALGLPCVLKQPDSAFSMGVVKVDSVEELHAQVSALLEKSELILAQEYLPTEFDWRIGIIDRRPLFACKYFMVPGHWQIIQHEGRDRFREGRTEAVALDRVPPHVLQAALEAANLIGDGFYGVDLKERGQHCYVIEINDNPNVDAGNEDGVLQDALYREVMTVFRKRIEARKRSVAS